MRPEILFVTPVIPQPTATGIKMRAYQTLVGLSQHYSVRMVVLLDGHWRRDEANAEVRALCRSVTLVPRRFSFDLGRVTRNVMLRVATSRPLPAVARTALAPWLRADGIRSPADAAWGAPELLWRVPKRIHVFRLRAFPAVAPLLRHPARPRIELDIDDIESLAAARIAACAERDGRPSLAWFYRRLERAWRPIEDRWLPRVARAYVCSRLDVQRLASRFPGLDVGVLPNVVDLPAEVPAEREPDGVFRFLFIGALGYYPNLNAAEYIVRRVIPALRQRAAGRFEVVIAGRSAPAALKVLMRGVPEVDFVGEVADIAPVYARCDAVMVPIFAGGGTRIKVLEAFAHGRPVVASGIGAEGIEAVPGQHLLQADDLDGYVECAARLMRDKALRERLRTEARRFVADHHSPMAMARALGDAR